VRRLAYRLRCEFMFVGLAKVVSRTQSALFKFFEVEFRSEPVILDGVIVPFEMLIHLHDFK
jgi:hypothetical protein